MTLIRSSFAPTRMLLAERSTSSWPNGQLWLVPVAVMACAPVTHLLFGVRVGLLMAGRSLTGVCATAVMASAPVFHLLVLCREAGLNLQFPASFLLRSFSNSRAHQCVHVLHGASLS